MVCTLKLLVGLLIILPINGCRDEYNQKEKRDREEAIHQLDILYNEYLTGDIGNARKSILKAIGILEENTSFIREGRAHGLWFSYMRLYCIEKKAGDENAAYLAFIKAQYWYSIKLGFSQFNSSEITQKLKAFTPERCIDLMAKWDKKTTDGKGPAYLREKTTKPITTMPK